MGYPKPTRQRILEGNPSKRPLNVNEPVYRVGIPKCPGHLSKEAQKEWKRIAPMLDSSGVLTDADTIPLGNLCEAYATLKKAQEQLDKTGLLVKAPSGYIMQSPLVSIVNSSMEMVNKLCREFGMTPSSRTRLEVDPNNHRNGRPGKMDDIETALCESLPN